MDDMNDRSAAVNIGGQKYGLLLSTRAAKEIGMRYGGLGQLGEKLLTGENFEELITEFVWLITLLANQAILKHNLINKDNKELLSEDAVEILTEPADLEEYKDAILLAMYRGSKRNVESEEDIGDTGKNLTAE